MCPRLPRAWLRLLSVALMWAGCVGCKVPINDVNARFDIADAAWFAEEETLFIFYEARADQGISADSVVEVRYTTDDAVVPWTLVSELALVHTHVPVDCGINAQCGSVSVHVPGEPRDVGVRLRYNVAGALSLESEPVFNVVGPGPAHTHRSLTVYGVLDATNRAVQWRARHRFPTIRNEEATRLGLRRRVEIDGQRFGASSTYDADNPYLYGVGCPFGLGALGWPTVETEERAVFNPEDLPDSASSASVICADATVYDAKGAFTTTARARKNPEARPAFPLLRSPVKAATPVKYLLQICERTLSTAHLEMQRQRLRLDGVEPVCIDDWMEAGLTDALVIRFRDDVDAARAEGRDMVISAALHHDDRRVATEVERALHEVLSAERDRNSPRLAGAFLLDTYPHRIDDVEVARTAIWCPASLDVEAQASEICVVPDFSVSFTLGPLTTSVLPILPSRSAYLDFLELYTEAQAGRMRALTFLAPERPTIADHVLVDELGGFVSFFNDERVDADADDAFSYCAVEGYAGFAFRSATSGSPLPLLSLPNWHDEHGEETYELGIFWDFPFAAQLEYTLGLATAASAFSFSLPIGIPIGVDDNYGSELWLNEAFPLDERLLQCRRFCDHPTFDSAGVYQVGALFRDTYLNNCYRPTFPARGGSGFPHDP